MPAPRLLLVLVLAALGIALAGCGGDDVRSDFEGARDRVEERFADRVADARRDFERRRERFGKRLQEVLGDLERVFPRAERTSPTVRSRGSNEPQTIDVFMTRVLEDVDRYWTRTFDAAGLPSPRVRFEPVPPGAVRCTAGGTPADDSAAFYCPGDDTIYVAQRFAAALYRGVLRGLPGERAGYGRAAGDFDVGNERHHGTPEERRGALLTGYETGEPARCNRYVPGV